MANIKSARKRARQADKRRLHNTSQRTMLRSTVKKVVNAISGGNKSAAAEAYKTAVPVIDRMANKRIIHANKAARHKSRLSARIKALQ